MKISFYTIDKTIVLAISYYQRTSMFFFRIRPYVCGVVRCHPTALFLVFWHDHTADGGSLLKYYVQQRDIVTYHIDKMAAAQSTGLVSERFNSMRCFFTEWGDQMALFPPLTNPNPRITIYQMCLSRY